MDKKRIIEISLMAVLVLCIVFNYISYKNKSEKESYTAASVEEQKSEIDDKTYDTYNRLTDEIYDKYQIVEQGNKLHCFAEGFSSTDRTIKEMVSAHISVDVSKFEILDEVPQNVYENIPSESFKSRNINSDTKKINDENKVFVHIEYDAYNYSENTFYSGTSIVRLYGIAAFNDKDFTKISSQYGDYKGDNTYIYWQYMDEQHLDGGKYIAFQPGSNVISEWFCVYRDVALSDNLYLGVEPLGNTGYHVNNRGGFIHLKK